ncbi:MAG TPA: type II toxin-antitoxin system VapC family toxin [Desulfobacteraceae bacterium]|nr:type II toxin-antitoxin system VapC family toxin [Desulfobacteraceae bacterium]
MRYIIDTNIITAIMKNNEKVKRRAQEAILTGDDVFINGISYYEIKRGLLAKDARKQLLFFDKLCKEYGLILLDNQSIFDRAAEIYAELQRKGELIEDADILIASIADTRNFTLVSDDSDFDKVQGLKVENWLR